MAKFSAHGAPRLLLNGERSSFGTELKDPFRFTKRLLLESPIGVRTRSRGVRAGGPAGVWAHGRRAGEFKSEERLKRDDGDADDDDGSDDEEEEVMEVFGFDELARDELSCFRGLVLDISYRPVNVVCWKRAICLEFMEKADVLEYYDQTVPSARGSFYIPAVLRVPHLLQVVKRRRIKHSLSRKNIFYRDNYTCQYCSSKSNLTIDHVVPISRGGEWNWENLAPKDFDILAIPLTSDAVKMLRARKGVPEEWLQYLGKAAP